MSNDKEFDLIRSGLNKRKQSHPDNANSGKDFSHLKGTSASWRSVQVRDSVYKKFEVLAKSQGLRVGTVINEVLRQFIEE